MNDQDYIKLAHALGICAALPSNTYKSEIIAFAKEVEALAEV